jgi:Phage integrase family
VDFATGQLTIRTSVAQDNGRTWEKDTKSHQQRRVTLDQMTLQLLQLYLSRRRERAAVVGVELVDAARMFSRDVASETWPLPDSISQRYARMCKRLGYDFNIKELRHYSATELIAAGVDLRTVAGRLGHSGGGVTTLRVYSAFRPEADDRAATTLGARLPLPPGLTGAPGGDRHRRTSRRGSRAPTSASPLTCVGRSPAALSHQTSPSPRPRPWPTSTALPSEPPSGPSPCSPQPATSPFAPAIEPSSLDLGGELPCSPGLALADALTWHHERAS